MSSPLFVVPIRIDEFHYWSRCGQQWFAGRRFVRVDVDAAGHVEITENVASRLALVAPEYEEDFEVLFAVVELDWAEPILAMDLTGTVIERPVEVAFEKIRSLHPLSSRGRALLGDKIAREIVLSDPLAEAAIGARERRRAVGITIRGSKAFPVTLGLERTLADLTSLEDRLTAGMEARDAGREVPVSGAGFLVNLLCYDRHDHRIARNDAGYLQDIGGIYYDLAKAREDDDGRQVAKTFLEEVRASAEGRGSRLPDVVQRHRVALEALERVCEVSAAGCVVFLKMQACYRDQNLDESKPFAECRQLVADMVQRGMEMEATVGAWLNGAFFGFTRFADEYYRAVGAPLVRAPQRLPTGHKTFGDRTPPKVPSVPSGPESPPTGVDIAIASPAWPSAAGAAQVGKPGGDTTPPLEGKPLAEQGALASQSDRPASRETLPPTSASVSANEPQADSSASIAPPGAPGSDLGEARSSDVGAHPSSAIAEGPPSTAEKSKRRKGTGPNPRAKRKAGSPEVAQPRLPDTNG